uniref:Uncharacterized protein n=1 Tax=Romanomermis culicivorax TaxID=13658 RepID=A0A915IUZ8_ROMCU
MHLEAVLSTHLVNDSDLTEALQFSCQMFCLSTAGTMCQQIPPSKILGITDAGPKEVGRPSPDLGARYMCTPNANLENLPSKLIPPSRFTSAAWNMISKSSSDKFWPIFCSTVLNSSICMKPSPSLSNSSNTFLIYFFQMSLGLQKGINNVNNKQLAYMDASHCGRLCEQIEKKKFRCTMQVYCPPIDLYGLFCFSRHI